MCNMAYTYMDSGVTTVYCRKPLLLPLLLKSEPSESILLACLSFTYLFIPREKHLAIKVWFSQLVHVMWVLTFKNFASYI